jgi:hypothetical protein
MKNHQNNAYLSRKSKLLRSFDKTAVLVRDTVVSRYGEEFADTLYQEARQEFETLIPQMPYIDNPMLKTFLFITTQELAVYKAMKRSSKTPSEAWEICHDALRLRLNNVPKFVRWLVEKIYFSNFARKRMQESTAQSQEQPQSGFVMEFVAGDGEDFDYGVDYLECTMHKFVCEQGATEFAPYACLSDIPLGDTFGWGVIRSETLADGCQRCNFRFKKGGKTRISSPTPAVQATIERIRKREAD